MSLFTDKSLNQTIGSNDINIYLSRNKLYDRVSTDTAEAEPYLLYNVE